MYIVLSVVALAAVLIGAGFLYQVIGSQNTQIPNNTLKRYWLTS